MTLEELKKELLNLKDHIRSEQAKRLTTDKRVPLMAEIIAKKDEKEARAMIPIDSERRHETIEIAGREAHKFFDEVIAIIVVSECWFSKQPKDQKEYIQPSKDPERQEVLMISGMTREGITDCKMFELGKNGELLNESADFAGKSKDDEPIRFESPLLAKFWPKPANYIRPDFRKEFTA